MPSPFDPDDLIWELRIKLGRSVNTFEDLYEITRALTVVDRVGGLTAGADVHFDAFSLRPLGRPYARLRRFRISSPPQFVVEVARTWLAGVFVILLTDYPKARTSAQEIGRDLLSTSVRLKRFSAEQRDLVYTATTLLLANTAEMGEEWAARMSDEFRHVRLALLGEGEEAKIQVELIKQKKPRRSK